MTAPRFLHDYVAFPYSARLTPAYADVMAARLDGADEYENPHNPGREATDFADWRAGYHLENPVYRP